jgi:hypothetical protein
MTWINLSGKSIAAARRPRRCLCAVTVHRLLERFRSDGPAAIRHRARGRVSNRRIDPAVREFAMTLVGESYPDFGPTLAAEKLQEDHGLTVSRETLRQWMQDAGIWLSRKQRRTFHQPRLRRECHGELVQIDGSDHRWFEDRGGPCTLLVFVDDATSALMHLAFVTSELYRPRFLRHPFASTQPWAGCPSGRV